MGRGSTSKKIRLEPELAVLGSRFWVVVAAVLSLALLLGSFRLFFGSTSYAKIEELRDRLAKQRAVNAQLIEDNRRLTIEIEALKNGNFELETRAREDLGLVKPGETFYLVVDDEPQN